MNQTPIYEEVRRTLGRGDLAGQRRSFSEGLASDDDRVAQPVLLRAGGGRHRRVGA